MLFGWFAYSHKNDMVCMRKGHFDTHLWDGMCRFQGIIFADFFRAEYKKATFSGAGCQNMSRGEIC